MKTRIYEVKTSIELISCFSKCKVDSTNLSQIKNGIMINVYVNVKSIACAKNIITEILAHVSVILVSF